MVLELEGNRTNVAGIGYTSGNEEQIELAANINYIVHQIQLRNQPCYPLVESIPQIEESDGAIMLSNSDNCKIRSASSLWLLHQGLMLVCRIPKKTLIRAGDCNPASME